jgi:threonine/homoserine/homoserine lactone efflux protein
MLSTSTAALMVSGCAIVLLMPGPTNTLLAAAGLRYGLRRSAHLAIAELAGYLVSISIWGYGLSHASPSLTWLPTLLRAASSLYLAWLAVRMWLTANAIPSSAEVAGEGETERAIGPRTLFTATLLNPKAILFAGTIFPSAAFLNLVTWLEAMAIFTLLLVPIGLVWIWFGAELGRGRLLRVSPGFVQRCASVVVAAFSLSLLRALVF